MPNRGSQSVHDNDYKWLVEVYGETCLLNKEHLPPAGRRLQVDHISDDPAVYDLPSNKSLVCAGCNCWLRELDAREGNREAHRRIIENARLVRLKELAEERGRSAQQNRGVQTEAGRLARQLKRARKKTGIDTPLPDFSTKQVLEYMNGSSEMKANAKYQPDFAAYVWTRLCGGPVPEKRLLNGAAAAISGHPSQLTLKRYLEWMYEIEKTPIAWDDSTGERVVYFKDPARASRALSVKKEEQP